MSFFYCTYFSIYERNNRIFLFNELRKSTYYYSIFMDLENLSIFFFLFRFVQIYHRFSWERTIWFLVRVRKACMCDNCEIASVRGNIHLKRMIHRWLLLLHEIREKYIAMIRLEMKAKNVISKGIRSRIQTSSLRDPITRHLRFFFGIFRLRILRPSFQTFVF